VLVACDPKNTAKILETALKYNVAADPIGHTAPENLSITLDGAAVVSAALLRRQLDFRRQSFIDIGSYLLGYGGVAVGLALLGYGVWSLAWGSLAQTVVASGAQLAVVRHAMRPLLGRRELADLLRFRLGIGRDRRRQLHRAQR